MSAASLFSAGICRINKRFCELNVKQFASLIKLFIFAIFVV